MSIPLGFLLFAISIPLVTASQEPKCSRFDYDERILRKLLLQERVIQDLETNIGELKAAYEGQISSVEKKLNKSTRRLEESCKGTIIDFILLCLSVCLSLDELKTSS